MGSVAPSVWDLTGRIVVNEPVSAGLIRLDVALPRSIPFAPGQFAMLDLGGAGRLVFRRPLSILGSSGASLSFLYRVVGRGTARLAKMRIGESLTCLAPLGRPFPARPTIPTPALLLAGGVGLPPIYAWLKQYGQGDDLACFGARDGGDVPWGMMDNAWNVSVERETDVPAERLVHRGRVTDLASERLRTMSDDRQRTVLACGPTALLRAAARLAADRGWTCYVSLEEHMGCGYGVCKGCVVPVVSDVEPGWRHATSCTEGPVFDAATLDWDRFDRSVGATV